MVPVRIPPELGLKMDKVVSRFHYRSRSEFIREAIQEHVKGRLEEVVIEVKDVPVEEAARMVDRYLGKNAGAHYVSEIAEALGLELRVAFEAVALLKSRGAVGEKE